FLGKLYILRALVRMQVPSLAVILVLASLVSYFYYLRVIVVMYMRPARSADDHAEARLSRPALAGVSMAAFLVVALFFTAGIKGGVMTWAEHGERSLFAWAQRGLQPQGPPPAEGAQARR
ncbi:MAG: hypothetical protein ICV87_14240, partial [Gemmatimonadetes bacterium]|nr:hypothetical protein [Gemmatimonadota bacterium]